MYKKLLMAFVLTVVLVGASKTAFALTSDEVDVEKKVDICHGTESVTNPYIRQNVNVKSNVSGHGEHTGPIATSEAVAEALKATKPPTQWGDIIPPNSELPDGLNWTVDGQAMWNNDCQFVTPVTPVVPPVTPDNGTVLGAATTAAPQVKTVPAKGVGAGAGGSARSVVPALVAMTGSLTALGYGVLRFRKFNG